MTYSSRSALLLAAIILITGAFYAGKVSNRAHEPSSLTQTSTATSTVATSTATTTLPSGTKQITGAAKAPTPSSPSYTPVLTRIAVSTRGNTTILKCTGVQLSATGFDQKGAVMVINPTWSTSDNTIATVSSTGGVASEKVGRVVVTARSGGISDSIPLTIIGYASRDNSSPCPAPRR